MECASGASCEIFLSISFFFVFYVELDFCHLLESFVIGRLRVMQQSEHIYHFYFIFTADQSLSLLCPSLECRTDGARSRRLHSPCAIGGFSLSADILRFTLSGSKIDDLTMNCLCFFWFVHHCEQRKFQERHRRVLQGGERKARDAAIPFSNHVDKRQRWLFDDKLRIFAR